MTNPAAPGTLVATNPTRQPPHLTGTATLRRPRRTTPTRHPADLVSALGTARRLQAQMAIGWTKQELASHFGYRVNRITELLFCRYAQVSIATHTRVAQEFTKICMEPHDNPQARAFADKHGFRSALYWDDIDNDPADLNLHRVLPRDTEPDEIAVELACSGELDPAHLRPVDLRAALSRLCAGRMTVQEISDLLDVSPRTVDRHRARVRAERRLEEFAERLTERGRGLTAPTRRPDDEQALALGLAQLLAVVLHLARPPQPRYVLAEAIPVMVDRTPGGRPEPHFAGPGRPIDGACPVPHREPAVYRKRAVVAA
ncbi:helix-turn-helix domain-containing protein [Saccharothrix hoggarensis]|uniref:Helix-turn-helix domain-containing protein n=1 Tax=Saccharothrix hoggarensis TaxID=913853 RepID=A0ABW3QIA1_9PSEU